MFFMILARDREGSLPRRLEHRQKHIDYWQSLGDTLKVAGAILASDAADAPPVGSSFLLEAADIGAARALIAGDPFTTEGVFGDDIRIEVVRPAIGVWKPA